MKKTLSLTMLAVLLFAGLNTMAQKAEEDAIKKVIQQETTSFFHKDFDAWSNTWAHDTAACMMRSGTSDHYALTGWNAIAADYKQSMASLTAMSDEDFAPYANKTDYQVFINGNMAAVTFKEGDKDPSFETRTMVKQNGSWKILNMTILENSTYLLSEAFANMKALAGKWEYDDKSFVVDPNDGSQMNNISFELKETPDGLQQLSNVNYTANNQTFTPPAECEYFIPDYNTNQITYMDIQKNTAGQTFTNIGKVTSDAPNSFTVTCMYSDKPTAIQYVYTVTLKDGKWHQVSKYYGRDGKQTQTFTFDMHRI